MKKCVGKGSNVQCFAFKFQGSMLWPLSLSKCAFNVQCFMFNALATDLVEVRVQGLLRQAILKTG